MMESILKTYLRRLNNLSRNNRSLCLLRLPKKRFIDLHQLNYATGAPSFSIIQHLFKIPHHTSPLCPVIDSRDQEANIQSHLLKQIDRTYQFLIEERGSRDLYIGWLFVEGKMLDGRLVRSPLIFIPVELFVSQQQWKVRIRKGEEITLNRVFLSAYSKHNQVQLDQTLFEKEFEVQFQDDLSLKVQLYELFKKHHIEIKFQADNFGQELKSFTEYRKEQFEQTTKTGALVLTSKAVLGIFPQHTSFLAPDYNLLLEQSIEADNLEQFFAKPQKTIRYKEEETFTPFDIDAYQEEAMKTLKTSGQSIVVKGPPGTGKSQLICNMICDFIARGKKVLLVSQKRAALDVVYERLKQQHLEKFIQIVHDISHDRKEVYSDIKFQIQHIEEYKKLNNSLDSIQIERDFLKTCKTIELIEELLEEYKKALFDESECKSSAKQLYLKSNLALPTIELEKAYLNFTFDVLDSSIERFENYFIGQERYESSEYLWSQGVCFAAFQIKDLIKMQEMIKEINHWEKEISNYDTTLSCKALEETSPEIDLLSMTIKELENKTIWKAFEEINKNELYHEVKWIRSFKNKLLENLKNIGDFQRDTIEDAEEVLEKIEKTILQRNTLMGKLKWELLSKQKTYFKSLLHRNNLSHFNELPTLKSKFQNTILFETIKSELKKKQWHSPLPESFSTKEWQEWFEIYERVGVVNEVLIKYSRIHSTHFNPLKTQIQFLNELKKVAELTNSWQHKKERWSTYFTTAQIFSIAADTQRVSQQLNEDFEDLCVFHQLKASLSSTEQSIVAKLQPIAGETTYKMRVFVESLTRAWINHKEEKYPILRLAGTHKMNNDIATLTAMIAKKKDLTAQILLTKCRENTYQDLEYNRLNNRTTYRELAHQVSKKRKIWPLRKTIQHFEEEIFKLIPCWMCSLESTSAIFPMKTIFDLVIFDEASQCFSENAIPSVFRGKQLVISGDSQQLQPNDLYQVRWEEDENEKMDLGVTSILDLATNYLPSMTLQNHYRSKSIELIEFSNKHFYDNKLLCIPDRHHFNRHEPAIQFHSSRGIWDQGVNRQEANDVVQLILDQYLDIDKSIGVITFNIQQQDLIIDLLDQAVAEKGIQLPHSLFVKNIENVQGDEKDIIIFSVGYAADTQGKVRLQFGSLNLAGGENRLNVAITRAKEKIIVVSSILPHQMNVEAVKNEGPKLLKKYIEYAQNVSEGKFQKKYILGKSVAQENTLAKNLQNIYPSSTKENVPFADLSVTHDAQIEHLILTDDQKYFEALTAKQTFCYEPQHFTYKRWPFLRVHSREFWIKKQAIMDRFKSFINSN